MLVPDVIVVPDWLIVISGSGEVVPVPDNVIINGFSSLSLFTIVRVFVKIFEEEGVKMIVKVIEVLLCIVNGNVRPVVIHAKSVSVFVNNIESRIRLAVPELNRLSIFDFDDPTVSEPKVSVLLFCISLDPSFI